MKSKLLTIFLFILLISILIFLGNLFLNKSRAETNSEKLTILPGQNINPTPTKIQTPEYNYTSSTNLKEELNTINPEILNSDFESLKKIINSF